MAGDAVPRVLLHWACLTLAATFFWWTAGSAPGELRDPALALGRYAAALAPAALAAAGICAVLLAAQAGAALARLATASGLCYLGCLAVVGVALAPWAGVALAGACVLLVPRAAATSPLLLLVHAMGTLTGLYYVLSLERYLSAPGAVLDVLRAGWWLLG